MENDFDFVVRCIRSCKNEWQLFTAYAIMQFFVKKHKNEDLYNELITEYLIKKSEIC